MENFGFDLETREYNIQSLNASYIAFGVVGILMTMICIFMNTRRRNRVQTQIRRQYTV